MTTALLSNHPVYPDCAIPAIAYTINSEKNEQVIVASVSDDAEMLEVHKFFLKRIVPNLESRFVCARAPNFRAHYVERCIVLRTEEAPGALSRVLCIYPARSTGESLRETTVYNMKFSCKLWDSHNPEKRADMEGSSEGLLYQRAEDSLNNRISRYKTNGISNFTGIVELFPDRILSRQTITPKDDFPSVFDNETTKEVLDQLSEQKMEELKNEICPPPPPAENPVRRHRCILM